MIRTYKKGECPHCGSKNISYCESGVDGQSYYYECYCDACDEEFTEWYDLVYVESIKK